MRQKPDGIGDEVWNRFNSWADRNGLGTETDDWLPWWECWLNGYNYKG